MNNDKKTEVLVGEKMKWKQMENHRALYHREILSAEKADEMGVKASSILWEKIGVGGQVLPHYHDVAEIIFITVGKVKLLYNGEWESYKAGDTFQVPAGVVHSVANDDVAASEQISVFLPVSEDIPINSFFNTVLVNHD